jgi:sortase A
MGIASIEKALWILGVTLIATYGAMRADAEVRRHEGIAAFTQARLALRAPVAGLTTSAPDQSAWSQARIRAYALNRVSQPAILPEAVLRIPGVNLAVPIYADTSADNLNRGAGLISGTARPEAVGNVGIAAHRDGFFRALKDVRVGDRLEIERLTGTQVYRVSALSIVRPDDVRPLYQTSRSVVTLVTCYPFYYVGSAPRRYIVRAIAADY